MKQTIEIEVPFGYKAVYDKETQKVEVVCATLPKSWEEYCEHNSARRWRYFINEHSEIDEVVKREIDMSTIQLREMAIAFRALMQLIQLRDCYRQGWTPDWEDDEQQKHSVATYFDQVCADTCTITKGVLSFQSEEIRDEFLENFKDLIEKAKELI